MNLMYEGVRLCPKTTSESVVGPGSVPAGSVCCFCSRWFRQWLSLVLVPSVAFVRVSSVCCFRLRCFRLLLPFCVDIVCCFCLRCFRLLLWRWFRVMLSLALVLLVAFVCVGSISCVRLRWFRPLLQFVLVPSVAFVCVGPLC